MFLYYLLIVGGLLGIFVGVSFFGLGVFFTAVLALLFDGQFGGAFGFAFILLQILLLRYLGFWILSKHKTKHSESIDVTKEFSNERSGRKILQFVSDPFLRELYKQVFEREGFTHSGYENPPQKPDDIVELVLRENPDIIIMDIIMPIMDGFEATKVIKADSRTRTIPLCFLSNMSQPKEISHGLSLGAVKYFVSAKTTPSELAGEIGKILGIESTTIKD